MDKDIVFETDAMKVEVEWYDCKPYIHCTVNKWTPSIYKQHLPLWYNFLSLLRANKIPEFYSIIPKDKKILKFNKLMGLEVFEETETYYLMRGY